MILKMLLDTVLLIQTKWAEETGSTSEVSALVVKGNNQRPKLSLFFFFFSK